MNTTADTSSLPPALQGIYYPGVTVYGATTARLSWSKDGFVILELIEGTIEAPTVREVVRARPGEIQKFSSAPGSLRLVVNGKAYRMDSLAYAEVLTVPIPVEYKNDPIAMWLGMLSNHGVQVSRMKMGKIFLIALGITGALIAVIVAVLLVADM